MGLRQCIPVNKKLVLGSVYTDYTSSVKYCNGKIRQ